MAISLHMLIRLLLLALFVGLHTFLVQAQTVRSGAQVPERIAQLRAQGVAFEPVALFARVPDDPANKGLWQSAVRQADVLLLEPSTVQELQRSAREFIAFEVPMIAGQLVLDLERVDITADGFRVVRASDGAMVPYTEGQHYRGAVRGNPASVAAITIHGDQVIGMVADAQGQLIIGPFEQGPEGYHVIYRDGDLLGSSTATCATPDDGRTPGEGEVVQDGARTIRCVTNYLEVAYDIHQNKGGVTSATNYITGLFNQVAILFQNDGIDMVISEVFVWDVPSPYNATNSSGRLDQFGQERTSFNGDLAHLLDLGNYGGVAWLNTLCNSLPRFRMAYSGINSSFSNVPTYSWSVNVMAHEAGHNLGSRHTHACAWNGNNTAIDGCGPAAGYTEGSCAQGPVPPSSVGGTVMSYCHLTSSTVKFANGFGPQPAALMQTRVNSASCLAACGTSCDPPLTLTVTNLSATTANLGWNMVGATSYDLRWKPTASATWTQVNGLTASPYALTGLIQDTEYEYQVRSDCDQQTSAWSTSKVFATPLPCIDPNEPNNSIAAATVVPLPATINGLISPTGDLDFFRFTITANSNLTLFLSNVPADYDLRLRNGAGAVLQTSQNGGTSSEFISYTAEPGDHYAEVYGWNGANNATVCYTLSITATTITGCEMPDGIVVDDVGAEDVTLSWPEVQGASGYDLRIRETGASTWTVLGPIPVASAEVAGLASSTEYEAQVRSRCSSAGQQGTNFSEWTFSVTFTTLPAGPCPDGPAVLVLAQVWLDGAYRVIDGLMTDQLRTTGTLPEQEPYTALGFDVYGAQEVGAAVLAVAGNNAVVDWVLVELRSTQFPDQVVQRRAGLLQRDGDIVDVDGLSPLGYCVPEGAYHVAVRHRNHLGCMSSATFTLGTTATLIDLRTAATTTYGTEARRTIGAAMVLWAGNTTGDDRVLYTGNNNDRDPILQSIGGTTPTSSLVGYHVMDTNLDGVVRYTGADNDRDIILSTIGGVIPTNMRIEQLP